MQETIVHLAESAEGGAGVGMRPTAALRFTRCSHDGKTVIWHAVSREVDTGLPDELHCRL
jgi:hypothetical protein